MDKVQFGQLIQLLRKKKELTQKDLASALHVTPPSVCKWEQGKALPDIYMIENIASYFNLSYDDLYNPQDTIQRILSNESIQDNIQKPKKPITPIVLTTSTILLVITLLLIYINTKPPFKHLSSQYVNHETLGYIYQIEYSISSEQDEYCMKEHAKQVVENRITSSNESDNKDTILVIYYFDYVNKNNRSIPDYLYCHVNE